MNLATSDPLELRGKPTDTSNVVGVGLAGLALHLVAKSIERSAEAIEAGCVAVL